MANVFDAFDNDADAFVITPPRQKAPANFFARFDSEEDAEPPAFNVPQQGPRNFFDRFDNEPDAEPVNQSPRPAFEGLDPLFRQYAEHQSLDIARGSARVLTNAERQSFGFSKIQPPQRTRGDTENASFWRALEHGIGNRNVEAFADTIEHLADSSDDPSYAQSYRDWSGSLRKAVEEDGSDYRHIYGSFKEINGLSDAWGYAKESVGDLIGSTLPSLIGGITGGYLGQKVGAPLGKFGRTTGAFAGAAAGAMSGSIHLHVSEMRRALQGEKIEGPDLVKYTNYGAAILAGLDLAFPVVAGLKYSGPARQAIARKIALQIVKAGKLRAPSEFIKRFGKEIVKDVIAIEVPTEIAQEGVTAFAPPVIAGREVTDEEILRFVTETAPDIAIRTTLGAGVLSAPGSAKQAVTDIREGERLHAEQADRVSRLHNVVASGLVAAQNIEESPDPQTMAAGRQELQTAMQSIVADPVAVKYARDLLSDPTERGISRAAKDIFADELEQTPLSHRSFAGRRRRS